MIRLFIPDRVVIKLTIILKNTTYTTLMKPKIQKEHATLGSYCLGATIGKGAYAK